MAKSFYDKAIENIKNGRFLSHFIYCQQINEKTLNRKCIFSITLKEGRGLHFVVWIIKRPFPHK
jgi:hypothetical protein